MKRGLLAVGCVTLLLAAPAASRPTGDASPIEEVIAGCPSAAQIAAVNADLSIAFEGDPVGSLICRAAEGSADLTAFQTRVYQTLRGMKALQFERPLPWTSSSLYDWLVRTISGIRVRTDIEFSSCCEPAGIINIAAKANSVLLVGPHWVDDKAGYFVGLQDFAALLIHEARHNETRPHTCRGSEDATLAEGGSWATQYQFYLWQAMYSGSFLDAPWGYLHRFRDVALNNGLNLLSRICTLPTADLSLSLATSPPGEVATGARLVYTATVQNRGPDAAPDTQVYAPLPNGVALVSAEANQGTCPSPATATRSLVCSLGTLASGESATITAAFDVTASGGYVTNSPLEALGSAAGMVVFAPVHEPLPRINNRGFATNLVVAPPPQPPQAAPQPTLAVKVTATVTISRRRPFLAVTVTTNASGVLALSLDRRSLSRLVFGPGTTRYPVRLPAWVKDGRHTLSWQPTVGRGGTARVVIRFKP